MTGLKIMVALTPWVLKIMVALTPCGLLLWVACGLIALEI